MKRKAIVILTGSIFCLLIGISSVKAELQTSGQSRDYYYPNHSYSYNIKLEAGDWLWWEFETYEEKFMVNVTLYSSFGEYTNILSVGKTEDSGGIFMTSVLGAGFYELTFMNIDTHAGYMETWYGINEEEEQESIQIHSPSSGDTFTTQDFIDIKWEITGRVFSVDIGLRDVVNDILIKELYSDVQCSLYYDNSITWSIEDSIIEYSGKYRIKITDSHDSHIYDYSDNFYIEVYEEPIPEPEPEPSKQKINIVPIILIISIIPAIIVLGVAIFLIHKHRKKKLKEVITKAEETPQVSPPPNDFRYCNQCGEKIGKDIQFCSSCGAKQ